MKMKEIKDTLNTILDSKYKNLVRNKEELTQHKLSTVLQSSDIWEDNNLMKSLELFGQLEPASVANGEVVDGWRRYIACRKLGIEFVYEDLSDLNVKELSSIKLKTIISKYEPDEDISQYMKDIHNENFKSST